MINRDPKTQTHLYHSTTFPSNGTGNHPNTKPVQRESLPVQRYLPQSRPSDMQQRLSSSIDSYTSSNPFTHLRNQIGNLRTQLGKFMLKDTPKIQKQLHDSKRQDKIMTQSTKLHHYQQEIKNGDYTYVNTSKNNIRQDKREIVNGKNGESYTFQSPKFATEKSDNYFKKMCIHECMAKIADLQQQNKNLKRINEELQRQKAANQQQLMKLLNQKQEVIKCHKNDCSKLMIRNQQKLRALQEIHQKDIHQILQKLKQVQHINKTMSRQLVQKQFQFTKVKQQCNKLKQQITQMKKDSSILQRQCNELKKKRQSDLKDIQSLKKIEYDTTSSKENTSLLQQIANLTKQLQFKQLCISNLLNDVRIMQIQIESNHHVKALLSSNLRYIQQLNHTIIELQCYRLNQKYMKYNQ